jgi:hypothetical protein
MKKLIGLLSLLILAASLNAKEEIHSLESFSALYNKKEDQSSLIEQFRKMEVMRADAQNSLERLLKMQPGNLELRLRMGELLLQRARDFEQYALELDSFGNAKEAKAAMVQVKPLYERGLKTHYELLPRLKSHAMEPNVYLGISRTEASLGRKAKALDLLEKILHHPKLSTDLKRQVWTLRGDLSFDLARGGVALESYSKADSFTNDGTLEKSYIAYKLAWVHYNLKDAPTALETLKRVLDLGHDRYALKQEAVKDFALFASDLTETEYKKWNEVDGMFRYLKKSSDQDEAYDSMVYMGKILNKNGHRKRAVATFEYLIKELPRHPRNGELALTIVDWSKTIANQKELTERFLWLLDEFSPRSAWYMYQKDKPDVQKNVADRMEQMLRLHAVNLHKELQKEKAAERKRMLTEVTAKLYDAHIATFTDFPRIHYYRAEIHREAKNYAQAGEHYDKYLVLLAAFPKMEEIDKKFSVDAALGSVDVWSRAAKDSKHVDSFLASVDQFLKFHPKHPMAAKLAYDAAQIEFENKKTALALGRVQKIVELYPKTEMAVKAVNTALDILNKENDFTNLAIKARDWMNSIKVWSPAERVGEMTKELNVILAKTEAKACEHMAADSNKILEAALCFQRYALGFDKHPLASKSLYMSAELFEKWGDNVSAMDSLESLVQKYPKSDEATKGFSKLANVYEKTFQFAKASKVYEQLLSRETLPNREQVHGRLLRILYGLGEEERLMKWFGHKSTNARQQQELIASSYRDKALFIQREAYKLINQDKYAPAAETKAFAEQLQTARSKGMLTLDIQLELARWEGLQIFKTGDLGKADQIWSAGLKSYWKASGRQARDTEAAARLRLTQLLFWKSQFDKLKLAASPEKKLGIYQRLENGYAEVINMKAPSVALEALWETSKLFDGFGEELLALPQTKAQGEEMKANSQKLLIQIAKSAADWKIFSPVLTSALQKLKGNTAAGEQDMLNIFPWPKLPRWTTVSKEQEKWGEWSMSEKTLQAQLKNRNGNRSQLQRAALVEIFKENSLKDPELKRWSEILTQSPAIQLRIQAMMNDGDLRLAELYLEQYEDIFGKDAFHAYFRAQMDWMKGDYTGAYRQWSNVKGKGDFRSVYTAAAWTASLEHLVQGKVTKDTSDDLFGVLSKQAVEPWQQIYLAALCYQTYLTCNFELKDQALLTERQGPHLRAELLPVQLEAISGLIGQLLSKPSVGDETLAKVRELMSAYGDMGKFSKAHVEAYNRYQRQIEALSKRERNLAGAPGGSDS